MLLKFDARIDDFLLQGVGAVGVNGQNAHKHVALECKPDIGVVFLKSIYVKAQLLTKDHATMENAVR